MDENARNRRPRRSAAVSRKLERMRRKKAELDAEARERERREEDAIRQLAEHAAVVERIEGERDKKIGDLQRKIDEYGQRIAAIRDAADEKIRAADRGQAPALAALKDAGRPVEHIAALMDRPLKQVQRLLREAEGKGKPGRSRDSGKPRESCADSVVGDGEVSSGGGHTAG